MTYAMGQSQQERYWNARPSFPKLLSLFSKSSRHLPYNTALSGSVHLVRQKRTSRRWLWILLAVVCVLIIAAIFVTRYLSTLAGPVVTADNYYQAVLQKDYPLAYSYLTSDATLTSQNQEVPIGSQKDYVTFAQLLDKNIGPVTSYTVATTNTATLLVISTTRSKSTGPIHYAVRFKMVQVDGVWKIKDMDGSF